MAATNFTPIQLYFSTTASAAPTAANLAQGELAINITDGKLYYEDNTGVVQVIATKGAGTIGGSTTQIQYNNAGALAGNAAMVFNSATSTTTLTTLNLTNALGAIYGGTAQSTYAQGDVVYASAANTLAKLGIGVVNYILTSTGSIPQWVAPSSIAVLTATNLAGGLAGSVPYQSALDTTTFLAIGAANRVMTSTGTAPQWVTSLTGLTGVSSSSITDTGLTSGRVTFASTSGLLADSANLTFNGTTLTTAGLSNSGFSTLVKTLTLGDSSFNGTAVFAAATPAKLYLGTGTVTDVTSAISATNTTGAIASLAITPIAATNTGVTYTNASTLYIAGAPSAGTNITITNPYSLYIAAGASYLGGNTAVTGTLSATGITTLSAATTPLLLSGAGSSSTTLPSNYAIRINAGLTAANYGGIFFDGSTVYDSFFGRVPTALSGINDGIGYVTYASGAPTLRTLFSSTGLAVTGTLSATGTLSGGTSGTGYSFDGSAPANSLILNSTGNLGVGTAPAYKLHVVKGSAGITARFTDGDGITDVYGYGLEITRSVAYIKGSGALHLGSAAGYSAVVLDSAGNLGLAVTPSAFGSTYKAFQPNGYAAYVGDGNNGRAEILNNAYASANNVFNYYDTNSAGRYSLQLGVHAWFQAPSGTAGNAISFTQAMTLDASGNLGIGTSSPVGRLEAVGGTGAGFNGWFRTGDTTAANNAGGGFYNTSSATAASRSAVMALDADGANLGGGDYFIIQKNGNSGTADILQYSNASIRFGTDYTTRAAYDMTLTADGYLLVGTTSISANDVGFRAFGSYGFVNVTTATGDYSIFNKTTTTTGTQIEFRSANSTVGSISSSSTATTYNTSSDYRLKNTIAPMTGALAKVAQLKPVTYKWNVDGSSGEGFIAHELAEVCSSAVTGAKDAVDADGKPEYQGIDTSFLVATLTAAIQEQQAIIESLKARLDAANL